MYCPQTVFSLSVFKGNNKKIVIRMQLVTARPLSVGHQCPTGWYGG